MKTFIHTFIFTFAVFVCSFVQGQTVHWILAIDGWANLVTCRTYLNKMSLAAKNGIKEDQLEVTELDLSGNSVEILDKIRNMKIGNNDTVIFYYFGQGTMNINNNNNNALTYCIIKGVGEFWEGENLIAHVATKYTYISKKSIIDVLRAKNPRLIVVLSDYCSTKSSILLSPPDEDDSVLRKCSSPSKTLPLYRSLFLKSKGLVEIDGAQNGKSSNQSKESIFTDAFCLCLDKYKNQRMNWKTFFSLVQKTTKSLAARDIKENNRPNVTGQKTKAIALDNT